MSNKAKSLISLSFFLVALFHQVSLQSYFETTSEKSPFSHIEEPEDYGAGGGGGK